MNSAFSRLQKYAVPLTVLIILLAFAASPYLIPENPDSVVFRSGVLSSLLLASAAFPVFHALCRHSERSLKYGFLFGFILAVCLSIGCELYVYDRFLPGMGSMLRRIAVPCMASPLLGALSSYFFTFCPSEYQAYALPFPYFFLLFLGSYTLFFLAFYPGIVAYDFEHEIAQYTSGVYQSAHPVFHTLLIGTCYRIGELLFGSMTAGAATYTFVQYTIVAALYAWVCAHVSRNVHPVFTFLLALCFAFLPFHGVLAISTIKDSLFTALCTAMCTELWSISEDPGRFTGSLFRKIRFAFFCLCMALLRHNAIFAYLPGLLCLLFTCKPARKVLPLCFVTLLLCTGTPKLLDTLTHAASIPGTELMSIPCQQLMRTAARGDLSPNEYEDIAKRFSFAIHRYRENCADPAKGGNFNLSLYQKDPINFWRTWAHYGIHYPRIYLEAFLENCIGIWYPGDTSHGHTLSTEEATMVYLNTAYYYQDYDIHPVSLLPGLRSFIRLFTHDVIHEKIPLISFLFIPSTYSFLLLLLSLRLRFLRLPHRYTLLPLWGIFLSILFSAGVFVRYAYPLMAATPVFFCLAFSKKKE